jgi:hypothetical protein
MSLLLSERDSSVRVQPHIGPATCPSSLQIRLSDRSYEEGGIGNE